MPDGTRSNVRKFQGITGTWTQVADDSSSGDRQPFSRSSIARLLVFLASRFNNQLQTQQGRNAVDHVGRKRRVSGQEIFQQLDTDVQVSGECMGIAFGSLDRTSQIARKSGLRRCGIEFATISNVRFSPRLFFRNGAAVLFRLFGCFLNDDPLAGMFASLPLDFGPLFVCQFHRLNSVDFVGRNRH